jgi:DNA-binding transcriptional MerR regulator
MNDRKRSVHLDKSPDAFRTISEVADDLDIPQHVLRFWETRFTQIKPMKRSGGRRYYRPDDVDLLRGIRRLLYGEGYTIRGVQRILKEQGAKAVQILNDASAPSFDAIEAGAPRDFRANVENEISLANDDDEAGIAATPARSAEISAPLPRVNFQARPQTPEVTLPAAESAPALDTAKLQAALADLVACRQILDGALKEG